MDFIAKKPFSGIGSSLEQIRKICFDRPDVLDLIDRACQRPVGRPETSDNVRHIDETSHEGGNAKTYAVGSKYSAEV